MNQSMSRILAFVAAAAVLSCDLNDSSESSAHSPRTVQYAPRLLTAAGTPVPAVDSIYVR